MTRNFCSRSGRLARALVLVMALCLPASGTSAFPTDTLKSVVSVLPVWPGQVQGGAGQEPGLAPEGSGIAIGPGLIATAWHVVEPAERIDVRLSDGRILPADLVAGDPATDVAVLRVAVELPVFEEASELTLAEPVCAVGNAFGLGLSVTCGVLSATGISNAGFNPVEDFVQTDAAINPGASGGALVNARGELVGMISAIFASQGDSNIGVNFAVSAELLARVTPALVARGAVRFADPGWTLEMPDRATRAQSAAPAVAGLEPGRPAAEAGLRPGDLVIAIEGRAVQSPRDAVAALAHVPETARDYAVDVERQGERLTLRVAFPPPDPDGNTPSNAAPDPLGDCPYPMAVCMMRQAVFPVSSFDPVGSATRIGPDLLVTNRHVVGDRSDAVVHTPNGPRGARVIASAYTGDLVLLQVPDLPADARIPELTPNADLQGDLFVIGADITREEIRVFDPGQLIALPAPDAPLGRVHVTSRMQPGVSGGALVSQTGALAGIAVGGGQGRFEALPLAHVVSLLALRDAADSAEITAELGDAFVACQAALDAAQTATQPIATDDLATPCGAADNHGQLLEAGRVLARAGAFDAAADLHLAAVRQVPNSINARMSLLVSLQLGARFSDMVPHARRLMELAGDDPQALRFAIQSGVWGDAPALAEDGYRALLVADPAQAEAARRFIDSAPPAPQRR